MKVRWGNQLKISQYTFFILFFLLVFSSCKKKEDEKEEEKIRKELEQYRALDQAEIKRVFHENELNGFNATLQRKCKLLDITISGFHLKHVPLGYKFVSVMNITMDLVSEFESLNQLLTYIQEYEQKYIKIEELKIGSQQTGRHTAKLVLKILYKDYLDKDFLPDAVKALAGVTIDQLDYLRASSKVYRSRFTLVKMLTKYPIFHWHEKLNALKQIPENVYIKELSFKNTVQSESIEILARATNDAKTIKAMNLFFDNLKGYSDAFTHFNKSLRETPLGDGTAEARFVYSLNHDT